MFIFGYISLLLLHIIMISKNCLSQQQKECISSVIHYISFFLWLVKRENKNKLMNHYSFIYWLLIDWLIQIIYIQIIHMYVNQSMKIKKNKTVNNCYIIIIIIVYRLIIMMINMRNEIENWIFDHQGKQNWKKISRSCASSSIGLLGFVWFHNRF